MSASALDSRLRGNDERLQTSVIPAEAGIQEKSNTRAAKIELLNSLK
jgi:hypothetical protein